MLEVQKYLNDNTLASLEAEFAIKIKHHPILPLVILNYNQINSPKLYPIVRECRGLVLEMSTWKLVAKSFSRFFNWGEIQESFNFKNFTASSKEDGTLIILYNYEGQWIVNTRQTFGDGIVNNTSYTWQELVCKALSINNLQELTLSPDYAYSFELCSPYNKVVTTYQNTELYFLSAFDKNGNELNKDIAEKLVVGLPVKFTTYTQFNSIDDILVYLRQLAKTNPTFEGVVIRDDKNVRFKIKNESYLALHRLSNNGSVGGWRNIVKLILIGEEDEVLTYFPELNADFNKWTGILKQEYGKLRRVFLDARDIERQKDFAIYINGKTPYTSLLFSLRKQSLNQEEDLEKMWQQSYDLIIKVLEKNYILT
jgi:hypothetical protein